MPLTIQAFHIEQHRCIPPIDGTEWHIGYQINVYGFTSAMYTVAIADNLNDIEKYCEQAHQWANRMSKTRIKL